jgi:two-component system chemotaxis response regulator CheB
MLKNSGSSVWAQDENTCVIYGMPKAVVEAGIASKVLPIEDIAANIVREFSK